MLEKIKQSYNYTDIVFGTHTLHKFQEDLKKKKKKKSQRCNRYRWRSNRRFTNKKK